MSNLRSVKQKVLNWLQPFGTFCFLDNQGYRNDLQSAECLAAAGSRFSLELPAGNALGQLQSFQDEHPDEWIFGHLGYDLHNETESLHSAQPDGVGFPDLHFFVPETVLWIRDGMLTIRAGDPLSIWHAIDATDPAPPDVPAAPVSVQSRLSKEEYLSVIRQLQQHIQRGDCYEINFCQEFFAEQVSLQPLQTFLRLCRISPNPFSALYRFQDRWLICASPERFLKREGRQLISQPMKGTSPRYPGNTEKDEASRLALSQSEKDRSENVMVVDLVRNDLSRVCREGSVEVTELFGVYGYPQVYQMISTIRGEERPGTSFADIIHACFPMGSMTGAPKKRVMQLIEEYEKTKRGLFSGALGYIRPRDARDCRDFDFNVVIRSILYNQSTGYLSFQAGSGITHYSHPESEWEECRLKAAAIRMVLE